MVASASSTPLGIRYGTMPRPRGQNALVSGIMDQSSLVATSFSIILKRSAGCILIQ